MAHRPDPAEFDRPLSAEQLEEVYRSMAMLSPHHVQEAYRSAYAECRMDGDLLPRAAAIQRLVAGVEGVAGLETAPAAEKRLAIADWRRSGGR